VTSHDVTGRPRVGTQLRAARPNVGAADGGCMRAGNAGWWRTVAGVTGGAGVIGLAIACSPLGHAAKRADEAPTAQLTSASPIEVPPAAVQAMTPTASFAPLVDTVRPAVVAIAIEGERKMDMQNVPMPFRQFLGEQGPQKVRGEGSGFVISADGYVLTNNHVVDEASQIVARFADGREVKATVVGTDPATDVALLKLAGDESWPHVELASSSSLHVGDWVVAVGNPLGLGITVTAGIVSGTGRVLGHDAYDDFIQTDAAINQGNSGGPLFDTSGRVVGMNTAIIQGANTIGFAVPADLIRDVLSELQSDGKVTRGYIGVQLQPMDAKLSQAMGVPSGKGALVAEVEAGTPAAKAGLVDGDVITAFGGTPVVDSNGLIREVARHDPGEKVDLQVVRNGKARTMSVVLGERPGRDELAKAEDEPSHGVTDGRRLGVGLAPLPPGADAQGVMVQQVDPEGPADGALEPGDIIQQVGERPVRTPEEVRDAVRSAKGDIVLRVLRDGQRRFVVVSE
jgi:serine protease Do